MNNSFEYMNDITMIGRLCYLFMSIEKYLTILYDSRDWTPIARRMWQWTEHDWNTGYGNYSCIIPQYIFGFRTDKEIEQQPYYGCVFKPVVKTYEDYKGPLDENEYKMVIACYSGITDGNPDDEINKVLMLPYEFWSATEGTSFIAAEPAVNQVIRDMNDYLLKHGIDYPDINKCRVFSFERKPIRGIGEVEPGWGKTVNTEYMSIILNK